MSLILVIGLALVMFGILVIHLNVTALRNEIATLNKRLNDVQAAQKETLEFIFDAVDEFALICGETPEDGGEPLSRRIRQLRASLQITPDE